MKVRQLLDPDLAYHQLSGIENLDPLLSEWFSETAVNHWLIPHSPSFPNMEPTLHKLAMALKQGHDDSWLEDFLRFPNHPAAMTLLRSAITANESGDPQKAQRNAADAAAMFRRIGNPAGAARSRFEIVFALHRQTKGGQCLKEAQRLNSPEFKHYRWIQTQLFTERSICAGMANRFGLESTLIHQAIEAAGRFHYSILELRARGMLASFDAYEGRWRSSAARAVAGLDDFWKGRYPALRGFQFYTALESIAKQARNWRTAEALQVEILTLLAETHHLDFIAPAHFERAMMAEALGDHKLAQQGFEAAESLFSKLPKAKATRTFRANVESALAELEVQQGKIKSAELRLNKAHLPEEHIRNFNIELPYWRARAQIERARINPDKEQRYLRHAIAIASQGFSTFRSEQDHWDWRREVGPIYIRLLELEAIRPHDPAQMLADWEAFRYAELQGTGPTPVTGNRIARRRLLRRARNLHNTTLVSFAVLANTLFVWATDDRGIHEHATPFPGNLENEIHIFSGLCADSQASLSRIEALGSHLYEMLLAPVETKIKDRPYLWIETDELLSGLPWAALTSKEKQFLGQTHAIMNTRGLIGKTGKQTAPMDIQDTVLVAIPNALSFEGEEYLPLPSAEAQAESLAALYPHFKPLKGDDAIARKIVSALPSANIFHFAGHALSRTYGGELLVSGPADQQTLSSTDILRVSLRRTKLIVLSACSTASAEGDLTRDPNGLVGAFLVSGAERVLASHWDVDSETTARLMRYFYQAIHDGSQPLKAFQMASERVRSAPGTERPFYWASFQMFGTGN